MSWVLAAIGALVLIGAVWFFMAWFRQGRDQT